MALNYPTSTQWITFPVDLKDVKKITWSEGKSSKSATYYTRKGYWGDIANPKSLEDASKPRAEENGWESLDIKGRLSSIGQERGIKMLRRSRPALHRF